jgi:hypothetical protein
VDITAFTLTVSPVVVGLVEAIKRAAALSDRVAPLIAIGIGEGAAYGARAAGALAPIPDLFSTGLAGAVVGLAAAGLYAGTRTILDK